MGKAYCFYQNYREVRLLVIHCSATRYDRDFPVEALRSSHKARGFADIGYHSISHGTGNYTAAGRSTRSGARSRMERQKYRYMLRGRTRRTGPSDRYPDYAQRCTLMDLLRQLRRDYPEARILGHYQLSPYIRRLALL